MLHSANEEHLQGHLHTALVPPFTCSDSEDKVPGGFDGRRLLDGMESQCRDVSYKSVNFDVSSGKVWAFKMKDI